VDPFFFNFEKQTGLARPQAEKVIRIVSGHLAKQYPEEFLQILHYFLSRSLERRASDGNIHEKASHQ
jgi:hypothetical protein